MKNAINTAMSTTTIVAPTGVPATIDIKIPAADVHAASTPEHIVTLKKLLNILMAEIAGNTTRADISSQPTRFIATTITTAITTAMSKLYAPALVPVAFAKFSSNVTAKILL